jgi:signal transduction histidine kinase
MRANGLPIDVLLMAPASPGSPPSSWAMRNRILLEAFGHRALIATSIEEAAECAHDVDVALVLATDNDPLVGVAELWQRHASLPVVLCGDDIKEAMRAAAFEAGVALVVRGELMPQELDATLRLVCEQNRVGSPELVRGMCRAMCNMSRLAATANDTSFLNAAVQEVSELFAAPLVSIMLFDDDTEEAPLRLVAQTGLNPTVQMTPPRRGGVAEQVVRENKPRILLRNAKENGIRGVEGRSDITASMCVPIPGATNGADDVRPRGCINIARRRAHSVFTPRDLDIAVSIASLIGETLTALEARELSATLQQRMQAVERLSTVGEIAAGIAHEVANPIACVRSNVDVIIDYMKQLGPALAIVEENMTGDEEIGAILDDLPNLLCETWEGLSRTEEIVRQMKALVRLNGSVARDENVALGQLVEDTVRLLRPRVRVPVKVECDRSVKLTGSAAELSQVIVNLVVNAADACDERRQRDDKHEPEVRITVEKDGSDAVLHVIDNGAGIAPDALKRIFLPLFTTKTSDRGTGLGLAIVRRVVNDHGGRVHVRSTPGTGTAFTVAFPLAGTAAAVDHDVTVPPGASIV